MNNYEVDTHNHNDLRLGFGRFGSGFGFLPGLGFGRPGLGFGGLGFGGLGFGGLGLGLPFLTGIAAGALLRPRPYPYPYPAYPYPPYPYAPYAPYPPYGPY